MNGLDRFRDFAVPTISVKQGLSTAVVWSVLAARDGSIWLGTPDGLNRWNNGQITSYRKRASAAGSRNEREREPNVREVVDSGLPDDDIESLFQDDHGRIWVFTLSGGCLLRKRPVYSPECIPGGIANPGPMVHSMAATVREISGSATSIEVFFIC